MSRGGEAAPVFVGVREAAAAAGYAIGTFYRERKRLEETREFPRPAVLSAAGRARRWRRAELDAWLELKPEPEIYDDADLAQDRATLLRMARS